MFYLLFLFKLVFLFLFFWKGKLINLSKRYEREVNACQRSVLKLITEKDGSPASPMVLCVCEIHVVPQTSVPADDLVKHILVVTDGWYAIRARIDHHLEELVTSGKIRVGMKLHICNAELAGLEEACSPLELPASALLQLCFNGTRRAAWDAKMGRCPSSTRRPVALGQIRAGGGQVSYIDVVVLRQFPQEVEERCPDGHWVVRSFDEEMDLQRRLAVSDDLSKV